jgi:N-methylhydantoinase A/oxoprolinase/acetone carboxylase beta subunit
MVIRDHGPELDRIVDEHQPRMSYRVGVDIGGTFTDCVVVDGAGERTVSKALTTHEALADGVTAAIEVAAGELGLSRAELLAATDIVVHGTTVATNAILTGTGVRTGLITTRGHEDALIIGKVFSKRAGLTERDVVRSARLNKPRPIVAPKLIRGVSERVDVDGDVVVALDESQAVRGIQELVAAGVEAIAVSFLWSFVNDSHERRVAELLAERAPGVFVSLSCELAPLLGEYERTCTTALNAYIGPKVVGYLSELEARLQDDGLRGPLLVMQASGGLTSVKDASAKPIVTLDSGPTGGILGARYLGELYGEPNVVCTDVGGTSFEVGLVLGGVTPVDHDPVVSQYSLRMPKVAVRSIGAGGGSIAWRDAGGLLRVGPQSAGSRPGPACYGLGGIEPTVTDADLVLGYLDPERFLGGRMALDRSLALTALGRLGRDLGMEPEELAIGVFRIINAHMADLIRKATIEQGHDPRECVLIAYGGAGPTHAAFYGSDIGAKSIMVLPRSTAFSAEGMLTCDVVHTAQGARFLGAPFTEADFVALSADYDRLEQRVLAQFGREGTSDAQVTLQREVGVRYRKQAHTLTASLDPGALTPASADVIQARFERRYVTVYGEGALLTGAGIELESQLVSGVQTVPAPPLRSYELVDGDGSSALIGERPAYFGEQGFVSTPVLDGSLVHAGESILGPAIVQRMGDSVVVPYGFRATVDRYLTISLERT